MRSCLILQVGLKLYMFIPAVILGILLAVFLWSLAMLALRTFGLIKKKVLSEKSGDLEMFPSRQPDKISEKVSYSGPPGPPGPPGFSSRLSSSHSSPVSLSSGIGVSERESESSADSCHLSCDCAEAEAGEAEGEGEASCHNSKLILTQHQRSR